MLRPIIIESITTFILTQNPASTECRALPAVANSFVENLVLFNKETIPFLKILFSGKFFCRQCYFSRTYGDGI